IRAMTRAADTDGALLGLVRVLEAAGDDVGELREALREDEQVRDRVIGVLGISTALVDHLVAHPEQWHDAVDAVPMTPEERTEAMLEELASPGDLAPEDAMRVAYRRQLLGIAALDVTSEDPVADLPETAAALADLAGSALEAAVRIATDEQGEDGRCCRFAVIGMGKAGGRELNYISDV